MRRFDHQVERLLRAGGWFPGRSVWSLLPAWETALRSEFGDMPAAAQKVLAEFGVLRVGERGPGVDYAQGEMQFDPLSLIGESDRYDVLGSVYPLADLDDGHGHMAIRHDGSIWAWYLDHRLWLLGFDIEAALDRHLLGKQPLTTIHDEP